MKLEQIAKALKQQTGKTTEELFEEFVQLCANQRMTRPAKMKNKHAYCELCEFITEWEATDPVRDERGKIIYWFWKCAGCGGIRREIHGLEGIVG